VANELWRARNYGARGFSPLQRTNANKRLKPIRALPNVVTASGVNRAPPPTLSTLNFLTKSLASRRERQFASVTVIIAARPDMPQTLARASARALDYSAGPNSEILVARGKQPSISSATPPCAPLAAS